MKNRQSNTDSGDDAALVKLYPPQNHKDKWYREASEHGTSASKYLQELIQEARFLRKQGQLKLGDRRQVEQLRDRIEQLEQQLENANTSDSTRDSELVTEETTRKIIEEEYKPIDQLLDDLLQDEEFRQRIRLQFETQLYNLGEQGQAVYRRGKGWKHTGENGGGR